jgi:hypothetical protein
MHVFKANFMAQVEPNVEQADDAYTKTEEFCEGTGFVVP